MYCRLITASYFTCVTVYTYKKLNILFDRNVIMKFIRPKYMEPGIPTEKTTLLFSNLEIDIPKLDYPITPIDNFKRVVSGETPAWAPNSLTDFQNLMYQNLGIGKQISANFHKEVTEDYDLTDWFGVPLRWCVSAGGATNVPGTHLLEDITQWERVLKFPKLSEWDWKTKADDFMKNKYDRSKVLHIDIHNGLIQRLILVLGGYTEGMYALALEPEAVKDFFSRLTEHMIELVDLFCGLYPVDMMTIHDDWGAEKDTFFSPQMMEDLVYEPTKRIIDHIKTKGVSFMMHSCGNVTRFIPYMIDMGVDFLQLQRRAVDIPALKEKYGDKIGFNTGIESMIPGVNYEKDKLMGMVRKTVDLYGKGGRYYGNIFGGDAETVWNILCEHYAYSREMYENTNTQRQ